jgi:hypothetical protein
VFLVGKRKANRQLEKFKLRCKDNIKMNLKIIGYGHVNWIHLTQDLFHILSCELVMDFRVT